MGQGGSWAEAERSGVGVGWTRHSWGCLCVPGTAVSNPFCSFCGAIISPILQIGQRRPEQLADLPRALQLSKWQRQGVNSGQCDSSALMSSPWHHLPDGAWFLPRLPFPLVSCGVEWG